MKLKNLVSIIIGISLTIGIFFSVNLNAIAGEIHNGDPCFSNDYNGQWVIGDIPGKGQPETKICIRGEAKKSNKEYKVSLGDYCYRKSEDNKSYLSRVIEQNGKYGCGYIEQAYNPPTLDLENSSVEIYSFDDCHGILNDSYYGYDDYYGIWFIEEDGTLGCYEYPFFDSYGEDYISVSLGEDCSLKQEPDEAPIPGIVDIDEGYDFLYQCKAVGLN